MLPEYMNTHTHTHTHTYVYVVNEQLIRGEVSVDVIAQVLDCGLEVSEFELQSCCYVHFWKVMNPIISSVMG